MQDLPLQIAAVHHVVIGDPQMAHSGRRQVERRRRSQAARTDHQHPRAFESPLPFHAHFLQQQVSRVTLVEIDRFSGHVRTNHRPPLVLPALCTAFHGRQTRVACSFERTRGIHRAPAHLADQHDGRVAVGKVAVRFGQQLRLRDTARAGRLSSGTFVILTHVDEHRTFGKP